MRAVEETERIGEEQRELAKSRGKRGIHKVQKEEREQAMRRQQATSRGKRGNRRAAEVKEGKGKEQIGKVRSKRE
jgi:hypothetical protein